jgi:hypothetical protein
MDFAIDICLTHPARDQLGNLGTEIEDQNLVVHGNVSRQIWSIERARGKAHMPYPLL